MSRGRCRNCRRHEVVFGIDLIAQLVAAAKPFPGQKFAKARTERHGGEEGQRGIFARVIAGRRPARFNRSLGDGIEALQGGMSAPGSKNFISNLPPDMRSMSLLNRTPDGPRWVRALPKALCIFQRTFSCALAAVAIPAMIKANRPKIQASASFLTYGVPPIRRAPTSGYAECNYTSAPSGTRHRNDTFGGTFFVGCHL